MHINSVNSAPGFEATKSGGPISKAANEATQAQPQADGHTTHTHPETSQASMPGMGGMVDKMA